MRAPRPYTASEDALTLSPEIATLLIAVLGVLSLLGLICVILLWRGRARLGQDVEQWRGRHDEQFAAASAAIARSDLIDSQRLDLESKVADERQMRLTTETTVSDLRARLDEQQRAAEARFVENEGKLAQAETRISTTVDRKEEVERAFTNAEQERLVLEQRLSRLAAEGEKEREHLAEQIAMLKEGREAMTQEFKALADGLMRKQGEDLRKSATEQLGVIVAPLRENMTKFEGEMRSQREAAVKEQASLKEQLFNLSQQSAAVSKEAETLAKALRGDSQKQGAWGEAILTRLLELAGLEEGREYATQTSFTNEDGRRQRPDVIVTLPGNRQLVIDSKVSLVAYDQAVNAETDDQRDAAIARHILSIQGHIKGLSGKDYDTLAAGSADYVIMFIPIEGALSEALRARGDLTEFALERNVMIATPTTLMMALRTIKNVWDVERRTQNAEDIASRAGALFDKVVGFTTSLEDVGKHLDKAKTVHDKAVAQLSTGSGNVLRQVEMLKELGAKTNKSLPSSLAIEADDLPDDQPPSGRQQLPH